MAVAFRAAGASSESNYAALTPGLPTRQAGDVLVLVGTLRSTAATLSITSGTGWTQRIDFASGWASGANRIYVWTRTATNDANDAVTITPGNGASGVDVLANVFSVSGANTNAPIQTSPAPATTYSTATTEDIATAALTVTTAGSLAVVAGHKANDSGASPEILTPSGATSIHINDSTAGDDALMGIFCKVTSTGNESVDFGTLDVQTPSGPPATRAG